ncbi:MAG: hypothetical protein IJW63_05200 [Lachnospiraceae bacterium]|nr:hypothetical protein [Lachnospiraceae bacterium]
MKNSRVFWGVFLILGAVFGLAAQMGLVQGVGGWAIFGTILFAALLIKSLMKLSFFGIFFSIAFIAIIYAEQLSITAITPWPILGAAFCLALGCSWLFPKKHGWKKYINGKVNKADRVKHVADGIVIDEDGNEIHISDGINVTINGGTKTADVNGEEINIEEGYSEEETVEKDGGDWVNLTQVFQSTTKYINSNNFAGLNAECVFCKVDIFFDGAGMQGTTASVNIENVFSTTTLYVPRTWTVKENNENVFAHYSESGHKAPDGVHTLKLNCENVFGGIKVIYV